jgi:hypothetical protein
LDIDISGCQVKLCEIIFQNLEVEGHEIVTEMMEKREQLYAHMKMTDKDTYPTRKCAKAACLAIQFDFGETGVKKVKQLSSVIPKELFDIEEYYRVLTRGAKEVVEHEDWMAVSKVVSTKRDKNYANDLGSSFATILQTIERGLLLKLKKFLYRNHSRHLDVLIHDGGMVRKIKGRDETVLSDAILRDCEKRIFEETGYPVTLKSEPLITDLDDALNDVERDLEDDKKLTAEIEAEFESKWSFIGDSMSFYRQAEKPYFHTCPDSFELVESTRSELVVSNLKDTVSLLSSTKHGVFKGAYRLDFKKWLSKIDKPNECDTIVMRPDLPSGRYKNVFNIFDGFNYHPREYKFSDELIAKRDEIIKPLLDLALSLVSGDGSPDANMQWLLCYFADMVQRTGVKPGVILILFGLMGVGKDIFLDAVIEALFGSKSYLISKSPGEDFLNTQYNSCIASCIPVKGEELSFADTKASYEKFKAMTTSQKMTINEKYERLTTVDSFQRFMFTTNNPVPLALNDGDRRTVIFSAGNKAVKREPSEWKKMKALFMREEFKQALSHYFFTFPIPAGFDMKTSRPTTQIYKDVITACRPAIAELFERLVCKEFDKELEWMSPEAHTSGESLTIKATDFFDFVRNQLRFGAKDKLTMTKFGRDISTYPIEKKKGMHYNTYTIVYADMKAHLKEKNWWSGFLED